MTTIDQNTTRDQAFGGLVTVLQHRSGYRFTVDALWLVAAARDQACGHVVDLGAGSGVVGLSLAAVPAVHRVSLIERQDGLAALAQDSITATQPRCPVDLLHADLRQVDVKAVNEPAQLVVCNPPFFDADSARPAAIPEQDAARRALAGDVTDFIDAAARLLHNEGALVVVFPARQSARLLFSLEAANFGIRALRFVQTRAQSPARLIIALAKLGCRTDLHIHPPWIEFDDAGQESPLAQALRRKQIMLDPALAGLTPSLPVDEETL